MNQILPKLRVEGSIPSTRSNPLNDLGDHGGGPECRLSAECPCNLFTARSGEDELPTQEASEARTEKSSADSPPIPSGDQTAAKTQVRG